MISQQATADPYWSRSSDKWSATPRKDPVVWPNEDANATFSRGLDAEELEKYERDGFFHAPQLFSTEEARMLLEESQQLAEKADPSEPGVIVEPSSRAVRSLFRMHRYNERFAELVRDPRLLDVARQVLGSDVYVHQSRINFKPGFAGKEFFWHSDFETWHIEDGLPRMRTVSVSISLTDNFEFNGPLMIVPGSHHTYIRCVGETPENHYETSLRKQEFGVPSCEAMRELVDRGGIQAPKGGPGSTLFFECNLMHGSASNISPYPRTNLFIVYNSVHNRPVEPFGDRPPRPYFLSERDVVPIRN